MKVNYFKWGLGLLAAGAAGVLIEAYFLEKYFFSIKEYDLGEKKSGKRLRFIHLTDLHLQQHLHPQHRKLAKKINQFQPDLLLFSGDTLDSSGEIAPVEKFLSLLRPELPKAAILGNHDRLAEASVSDLKEVFARHNGSLLINASKAYSLQGTRVMVTGLDDFVEGKGDLEAALKEVGHEAHHLLLIHSPLQQEEAKKAMEKINQQRTAADQINIRYIFAGHNHGGQIRIPGYVPVLPDKSGKYIHGWYNNEPPYLYLSKGFGTSSVPFRFFARSEMTVFNYYV